MLKVLNTRVAEDVYGRIKHCCQFLDVSTLSRLILPSINQRRKLAKLTGNRKLTNEQMWEMFRRSRALSILFDEDTPEEARKFGDLFREITHELVRMDIGRRAPVGTLSGSHLQARVKFINVKVEEEVYRDLKRLSFICYPSVSDFLYCEILSWCDAICMVERYGFVDKRSQQRVPAAEMVKLSLSIPTREGRREFGENVWGWAHQLADIEEEAFNLGNRKEMDINNYERL